MSMVNSWKRFSSKAGRAWFLFRSLESSEFAFFLSRSLRRAAPEPTPPADCDRGTTEAEHIDDWSSVSEARYRQAQALEKEYWTRWESRKHLVVLAKYQYYAGFYEWTRNRGLINPFRVAASRPQNYQLTAAEIEGKTVLDIGCGPVSSTLSLVHCAEVHVLDPLMDVYQEIQPFGWDSFASRSACGAERLPFEKDSLDFVHCRNVLDHTRSADDILNEVARVLRPDGQFLFACDVRGVRGGGDAHPYNWDITTLEERLFRQFQPLTRITLLDHNSHKDVPRERSAGRVLRWSCRLRVGAGESRPRS